MSDLQDMDDHEDDLLDTIRALVSEEEARAEAPKPKPVVNPFAGETADEPVRLTQKPAPLVLEKPVVRGSVPGAPAPAPMYDEDAMRRIVTDLVREELDQVMGEELEMKIRRAVRREIAMLAERRARRTDD
jgi:hypothetical protein